jgi:transposase
VDQLRASGYQPGEVWADRGYCSEALRQALTERGITPQISRRRKPGSAPPPVTTLKAGRRRERAQRVRDPLARHRWVVERTNAWLRRFRRLTIRTEPNSAVYQSYLTLAVVIILARSL